MIENGTCSDFNILPLIWSKVIKGIREFGLLSLDIEIVSLGREQNYKPVGCKCSEASQRLSGASPILFSWVSPLIRLL